MTRCACAVLSLLLLPAVALPQSLGDAAKKEEERRQAARARGGSAAAVVTEKELKASKGETLSTPGGATRTGRPTTSTRDRSLDADAEQRAKSEASWRQRVAAARARVEAAQALYDALDRAIRLGQAGERDGNGQILIYSAQSMKAMADAAQAEVAAAKKALDDLLEEARRAGALPGWLR